ncbi:MAG: CNNM domain-containing protein, partial [Bacillota bacterium]|nr:CNNM domain-containing protein [Bacillota bacterium]
MSIDPLPASLIIELIILLVNAYFSAARRAISSVNRVHIREELEEKRTVLSRSKIKNVLDIMDNPADYKFAIRCLNMLLYMLFISVARFAFADRLNGLIIRAGIDENAVNVLLLING